MMKLELDIREWARRDKAGGKRLRRLDNRRMEYLRSLYGAFCPDEDQVEVRSLLVLSLWIGNHLIAADHGERTRAYVLRGALRLLETQPAATERSPNRH